MRHLAVAAMLTMGALLGMALAVSESGAHAATGLGPCPGAPIVWAGEPDEWVMALYLEGHPFHGSPHPVR